MSCCFTQVGPVIRVGEVENTITMLMGSNLEKAECSRKWLAVTLMVVTLIGLLAASLGALGVFANPNTLPEWLTHAINTLGDKGCITTLVISGVVSVACIVRLIQIQMKKSKTAQQDKATIKELNTSLNIRQYTFVKQSDGKYSLFVHQREDGIKKMEIDIELSRIAAVGKDFNENGYSEFIETDLPPQSTLLPATDSIILENSFNTVLKSLKDDTNPTFAQQDLINAIACASKKFEEKTNLQEAFSFFGRLIEKGKAEDVLHAKKALLKACKGKNAYKGYELCKKIVYDRASESELVSIAIEAAVASCNSEKELEKSRGYGLFGQLLQEAPVQSLDPFFTCMKNESKKAKPCTDFFEMLDKFVYSKFPVASPAFKLALQDHTQNIKQTLIEIVNNLSNHSTVFKDEIAKMESTLKSVV